MWSVGIGAYYTGMSQQLVEINPNSKLYSNVPLLILPRDNYHLIHPFYHKDNIRTVPMPISNNLTGREPKDVILFIFYKYGSHSYVKTLQLIG